jgi:hypothetical protein
MHLDHVLTVWCCNVYHKSKKLCLCLNRCAPKLVVTRCYLIRLCIQCACPCCCRVLCARYKFFMEVLIECCYKWLTSLKLESSRLLYLLLLLLLLVRNQDNVSECSVMTTHRLLFQWANTIKSLSKRVCLVQSGHHYHLV